MQRKDLMELKKRFKKDQCTFTRMTGCYVNSQKEKVVTLNEVFLNLPDEEYYKYLEIAKKTLSGTLGNNLLELDFPREEEEGRKVVRTWGQRQFDRLLSHLRSIYVSRDDRFGRIPSVKVGVACLVTAFIGITCELERSEAVSGEP